MTDSRAICDKGRMDATLPSGAHVEYVYADAYSGPGDCYARQHCNSSCVWYRVNGGKWLRTNEKMMHRARMAIESCADETELHFLLWDECCER